MLKGKTILLVEDDPPVNRLYAKRLTREGATMLLAFDGVVGLEKLKAQKADLILLDLMMPRMNGYEMLKHVRENPETKDIPVIIITNTKSSAADIKKLEQLGIEEYIEKSEVTLAQLAERVSFHLNAKR